MDPRDVELYRERYEDRLTAYGYDPRTLGWGKGGRQDVRFSVLGVEVLSNPTSSILDVGCGFADLFAFLRAKGWRGHYTGVDLVPGLIERARSMYHGIDLRVLDGTTGLTDIEPHDHVICCGALNARLHYGGNEQHIINMLSAMWLKTHKTLSVDFMSTLTDFRHPDAWHTDPGWALTQMQRLTRRVVVRADYMPFEFALVAYRDVEKTEENIFCKPSTFTVLTARAAEGGQEHA